MLKENFWKGLVASLYKREYKSPRAADGFQAAREAAEATKAAGGAAYSTAKETVGAAGDTTKVRNLGTGLLGSRNVMRY